MGSVGVNIPGVNGGQVPVSVHIAALHYHFYSRMVNGSRPVCSTAATLLAQASNTNHCSQQFRMLHTSGMYIWVSFCRAGKIPVSCHFFFYREPSCGETMQNKIDFSIDFG